MTNEELANRIETLAEHIDHQIDNLRRMIGEVQQDLQHQVDQLQHGVIRLKRVP